MGVLITGSAGFIGFHLAKIMSAKQKVLGIDNLNNYYSQKLKNDRIKLLKKNKNFKFIKLDISNFVKLDRIIKKNNITEIIHLAAQAGVRYSITNPRKYLTSNLVGYFNILECCKKNNIKFLMYASSSSVYGLNNNFPLKESYKTDYPLQFYAATKKSNEIMAHAYSSLYGIKTIGLRFFTIYGPWGRPDMAYFKFADKIRLNQKISVYNFGKHSRDFTYIDDAVKMLEKIYKNKKKLKNYEIFNISNGKNIKLIKFIEHIYLLLNKKPNLKFIEKQSGDMKDTLSSKIKINTIYKKKNINYKSGLKKFVTWYKFYKNVKSK